MNGFLHCVKHILLFIFANFLAAIILGIIIVIIEGSLDISIVNLINGVKFLAILTIFGVVITIIPYLIAISIIKAIQDSPVWAYAIGGAASPLFLYFGVVNTVSNIEDFLFIVIFAGTGAICGFVYGLLDRKIQISSKAINEGGGHG